MIVSVENVLTIFGMPGDMNLRDALSGHTVYVIERVEVVVLRRNVDIVHIQQNAAVGAFDNLVEKLPLGHFRNMKLRIAADIFDTPGHFDKISPSSTLFCRD